MQLDLSDKVVLVTGSSKGIGREIAQTLHAEGCRVALNSRNSSDLAAIADQLSGSFAVVGDVTMQTEARQIVKKVLSEFGRLDILVCNVGSGSSVPPGNETADEWHRIFAQNLWSTTNMVEAARDALCEVKGVVVCISSICGLEVVPGAPVTYSAAKAALHAYVRGISRPLGQKGVRINAVAPGNIIFDGSVWSRKLEKDPLEVQTMLANEVSLAKFGYPENVASLVAYLASQRSNFVNGSIWTLDGGQVRS